MMSASRVCGLLGLALLAATVAAGDDGDLTAEQRQELQKKATDLGAEGIRQYQRREYAKAVGLLEESLAIRRRLYPKEQYPDGHSQLSLVLHNLGAVLKARGEYDRAERCYREALDMDRRLHPKDKYPDGHATIAAGLNGLGHLCEARGDYARAEALSREALDMLRRLYPPEKYPDGHPDVADGLNNVGYLLQQRGECARAEPLFREALAMKRRLYPKDKYPDGHADLATGLDNLSLLLQDQGEYARAEPFAREALEMTRRLYPRDKFPDGHPDLAIGLGNLGGLLKEQGEYARAEPLLREALAMMRRLFPREKFPDGHRLLALATGNLAELLRARRAYAEAEPLHREAVEIMRRLYPKEKFPDGHMDLAVSLHNLGGLLTDRREYAEAEAAYRESLEVYRRLYRPQQYPDGHPDLAASLGDAGGLLLVRGDYAGAGPLLDDALAMYRRLYRPEQYPDGHPDFAISLHKQGVLLQARREYAQARRFADGALEMHQRLALRYADVAAEAQALNYLAALPLTRDAFLSVTRHLPPDAADYGRLWDSRAPLTRLLERRHRDLLASRDDQARDLGRQLIEARQRLAFTLLNPVGDPEAHRKEVQKRTEAKEDLERRLARQLKLAPRAEAGPATPKRLCELLPEGAAFVDLLRYSDLEFDPQVPGYGGKKVTWRYVAFVLRRGRSPARVELNEAAPIDAAWADWHKAITAARPDEPAERAAAAAFADLVWRPLRDALPAGLRTVYLAPEGRLSQVPWAALPGREPGTLLLDECAVCLVPHGPFLLERLEEKAAPRGPGDTLLAYGGVDYAAAPGAVAKGDDVRAPLLGPKRVVWPELPGTAREQAQVAELARKVLRDRPVLRSGPAASTAQLLEDLPQARYAHLATHGFFADPQFRSALQVDPALFAAASGGERRGGARSPLVLSGLVLAGANRRGGEAAPDRGIITGEGLVGLPLEGLELAVLSACETGLGEDGGEEGAFGLQRAFHVAGCRNVVASLWKVDDAATQALMALFYRNLWERRLDAAKALRQAQLALYRHPGAVQVAQRRGADFSETDLPKVEDRPADKPKHSPAAHWAAFTFSGVRPPEAEAGR